MSAQETATRKKSHDGVWLAVALASLITFTSTPYAIAQVCAPVPQGTIAWWSFDETAGPTADDRVGDHLGGHTNGPAPVDGFVGGSLGFDGVNDYVTVADSDEWAFGREDFTIELWANFDRPGGGTITHPQDILIGNDQGPGVVNKWFFAVGGGVLYFLFGSPDIKTVTPPGMGLPIGGQWVVLTPFDPTPGEWYHLAVSRRGTTFSTYIDGELALTEHNTEVIPNANAPLTIGQAEQLGFTKGRLDEVTIYNRALAEQELRSIADAGTAGKCKQLQIRPDAGGDTGVVTAKIMGGDFKQGATVTLVRAGEADIVGRSATVEQDGRLITTTFDLTDMALGAWDVAVENPDESRIILDRGFTIEKGRLPNLILDLVGLPVIRPGRQQTYWVIVSNSGNTDAQSSNVAMQLPTSLSYQSGVPSGYPVGPIRPPDGDVQTFMLTTPRVPARSSVAIPLKLTAQSLGNFVLAGDIYLDPLVVPGGRSIEQPPDDLVVHPPFWDPRRGNPPPGYVVIYEDFEGGNGSAAWSLGDGTVAHWYPGGRRIGDYMTNDGINRHSFDLRDAIIIRPPDWSLELASPRAADFLNNWELLPDNRSWYDENGDNVIDDGEITSYLYRGRFEFPNMNCQSGVEWLWPEVNDLFDTALDHAPQALYDGLYWYWWQRGFRTRPYDLDEASWANWLPDFLRDLLFPLREIGEISGIGSFDPNDKVGSQGAGAQQFVQGAQPLLYSIFFENLETATAPAQEVVIIDQLDSDKLDLSTLSLGPMSFGDTLVTPSVGLSDFTTHVDLRPEKNLLVRIEANLNPNTELVTWKFTSLDPDTGDLPNDPLAGFLPPNVTPPEGDGSVVFTVMPKADLTTDTVICNQASIVFDTNEPIVTPDWCNTLDNDAPESMVLPLAPFQTASEFEVRWDGTDQGVGIESYTIYVSEDGAPYIPWLTNTPTSAGLFPGENGKRYDFYSVAVDKTNNMENAPNQFDATTFVASNQPPVARCQDISVQTDSDMCSVPSLSVDNGSSDPDGGQITLSQFPAGPYGLGDTVVTLRVTDDSGASDSCSAVVTIQDNVSPTINVAVTPEILWPANHKMRKIDAIVATSDICDPNPNIVLESVVSNELDNGEGDGNTVNDIQGAETGVDDRSFMLRAERSGIGDRRIYTITYVVTDASGNTATESVAVVVPHNQ